MKDKFGREIQIMDVIVYATAHKELNVAVVTKSLPDRVIARIPNELKEQRWTTLFDPRRVCSVSQPVINTWSLKL
jgi:hypothetical protein